VAGDAAGFSEGEKRRRMGGCQLRSHGIRLWSPGCGLSSGSWEKRGMRIECVRPQRPAGMGGQRLRRASWRASVRARHAPVRASDVWLRHRPWSSCQDPTLSSDRVARHGHPGVALDASTIDLGVFRCALAIRGWGWTVQGRTDLFAVTARNGRGGPDQVLRTIGRSPVTPYVARIGNAAVSAEEARQFGRCGVGAAAGVARCTSQRHLGPLASTRCSVGVAQGASGSLEVGANRAASDRSKQACGVKPAVPRY
jgi:hypothetical protein